MVIQTLATAVAKLLAGLPLASFKSICAFTSVLTTTSSVWALVNETPLLAAAASSAAKAAAGTKVNTNAAMVTSATIFLEILFNIFPSQLNFYSLFPAVVRAVVCPQRFAERSLSAIRRWGSSCPTQGGFSWDSPPKKCLYVHDRVSGCVRDWSNHPGLEICCGCIPPSDTVAGYPSPHTHPNPGAARSDREPEGNDQPGRMNACAKSFHVPKLSKFPHNKKVGPPPDKTSEKPSPGAAFRDRPTVVGGKS